MRFGKGPQPAPADITGAALMSRRSTMGGSRSLGRSLSALGNLVAHVLHRLVGFAFQLELDEEKGHALHRGRAQVLMPFTVLTASSSFSMTRDSMVSGIGAWYTRLR